MTAVLLQSNKIGSTGWISLRRGNSLEVLGMTEGDRLVAGFIPSGEKLSIAEDGVFTLPTEAELVQIEHTQLGVRENGGGVNIDLIKVRTV